MISILFFMHKQVFRSYNVMLLGMFSQSAAYDGL
jgi:hypothetical protein